MLDDLPIIENKKNKEDKDIKKVKKPKPITYDSIRKLFIIQNREELPPLSNFGIKSLTIDNPAVAINLYHYLDDTAKSVLKDYYDNYKLSYAVNLPKHIKFNVPVPEGKTLYNHQIAGVYYIEKIHQKQKGVLIADEMGLGKTIQVLSYINLHLHEYKRILIISPAIMKIKWVDEAREWLIFDKNKIKVYPENYILSQEDIEKPFSSVKPDYEETLNIYIVEPSIKLFKNNNFLNDNGIFVIGDTNLHLLFNNIKDLESKYNSFIRRKNANGYASFIQSLSKYMACEPFDLVIIDEAHILRTESRRAVLGSILTTSAANFILLTGTPIFNNLMETYKIFSILNLDNQKYLNYDNPKDLFLSLGGEEVKDPKTGITYIDDKKPYVRKNFGTMLRMSGMLRRTIKDVFPNFINKTVQIIPITKNTQFLTETTKQEHKVLANKIIKQIYEKTIQYVQTLVETKGKAGYKQYDIDPRIISYLSLISKEKDKNKVVNLLPKTIQEFSRYRQLAGIEKANIITNKKSTDNIISFYTKVNKEKLVLFIHHKDVKNILSSFLNNERIKYVTITGDESPEEKAENVNLFNNSKDYKVAICSIYASGVGIDLVSSKHAIFIEIDWVPANMIQAEARIYRIGQTQNVVVDYLVLKNTIDEKMAKIMYEKKKLMEETLSINEQKSTKHIKYTDEDAMKVVTQIIEEDINLDKTLTKNVNKNKLKQFVFMRQKIKNRLDDVISTKIQTFFENNKKISKIVGYIESEKLPYYIAAGYIVNKDVDLSNNLSLKEIKEYDYILAEYLVQNLETLIS